MLLALAPEARELADFMSALSEEAYCAGWMEGLEFELWEAVVNGPREYGRTRITLEHIARLETLSTIAGGWIVFDAAEEETCVPLAEWEPLFSKWRQEARQDR